MHPRNIAGTARLHMSDDADRNFAQQCNGIDRLLALMSRPGNQVKHDTVMNCSAAVW